ncbi:CinA family nicotinamide mononucleotide deamidase-related protein [Moheibacter stercoris]|uniref:CinA-like protein n=1 Tax=Moheibacter stercoris TaxID=1628251 RepID=A0ABV2LXC8_9FLAO
MKVRLITIGDEILIGQIVDTNSAYIAQHLNKIGLEVDEILSIKDDFQTIVETFERISKESDIIITTGGLGPTKDDKTKHALCEFLQTELVMDEAVLNFLEERYQKLNRPLNELNRNQALLPKGSIALPNPLGTAPGIWTEFDGKLIINLQGVPFEMKNLLKTEVIPRLQQKFSLPFVIHRFLSVSHFPESELAITLNDWEDHLPNNISVAYLPERSKVKLRLTGKGENKEQIKAQLEQEVQKLIPLLGERLDSTTKDSIAVILGDLLRELKLTISTAESCTGGEIASMLTSVSGSSEYFYGSVVSYATEVKKNVLNVSEKTIETHTVVSEEVAKEMAEGVRNLLKTELSVSTTGVAGPAKGEDGKEVGTVWVAFGNQEIVQTKSYFFPYLEREDFIAQVARLALQNVFEFVKEHYS